MAGILQMAFSNVMSIFLKEIFVSLFTFWLIKLLAIDNKPVPVLQLTQVITDLVLDQCRTNALTSDNENHRLINALLGHNELKMESILQWDLGLFYHFFHWESDETEI